MTLLKCLMVCVAVLVNYTAARADVLTREEIQAGKKVMVVENDFAKLSVLPDPGGTVIEFVDKKTGTDYVAGKESVLAGKLGFGWKDYYQLEAREQLGKWVFSLPYKAEFREGPGYHAVHVSCDVEGQRFEREMRLSDTSAQLMTRVRVTNISSQPRRLQVRWHTYSTLSDKGAENSVILAPGPDGQARKVFVGSGWDHQLITSDPYWMAVNYKDGSGIWMTFNKEESGMQITWTDYRPERAGPTRGMFVAEPLPQAVMAKPGESVTYESTIFPFSGKDAVSTMPMGMLKNEAVINRAKAFLRDALPNLAAIGPYTMTPGKPPGGLGAGPSPNRFNFSHRRRDRFALREWGMLDAMMAVPSLQSKTIRTRYYSRLFEAQTAPRKVWFTLKMIDSAGDVAREQTKEYTLKPGEGSEVDVQDTVALTGLRDGWYRFELTGYVEGEKEPIHTYVENRKLVGQSYLAVAKALEARESAVLVVRPFVKALSERAWPTQRNGSVEVPVGVEEGAGIARVGWPVRSGIPFAQGVLKKGDALALVSPSGKPVLLQCEPMATWMDGSVKWLLVEFAADVPANGHVFYTLKSASNMEVQEPALAHMTPEGPVIGGLDFGLGKGRLLGLFGKDDLWWQDDTGGRYTFALTGEDAGVKIEENGPARAVIKATGWYVNEKGVTGAMGELRLEAYRGEKFVRLYHTVTYAGDPWRQRLMGYGVRFALPKDTVKGMVEVDGKSLAGAQVSVFQSSADGLACSVDGKVLKGGRCNGAVVLERSTGSAFGIQHVNFWQMAPKKVSLDIKAGTLAFDYWPAEAGEMSFLPREDGWIPNSSDARAVAVGMGRTHEFVLDLACKVEPTGFDGLFNEPVVAAVPPKYLAQTKALMHLSPFDPERHPRLEKVASDTIDFYLQQQALFGWYGEWFYGAMPNFWQAEEFRWWDFGRYAWILNEQDIVEVPWLCFLRTGDRKYLKLGVTNTRHLMEVGTIRWNPVWPNDVGFSRRHHECIWLSGGDKGHSMLDPFLDYYYATGYLPAKQAAERMAKGMTTVTEGSWRYISNPIAGLSRMYLDTQNPVYKKHADWMWEMLCKPDKNTWYNMDHADRMVMWYSQINPECLELVIKTALDPKSANFKGADILTMMFLKTGDVAYAKLAAKKVPQSRLEGITQHVLSNLRASLYAGESIHVAKDVEGASEAGRMD